MSLGLCLVVSEQILFATSSGDTIPNSEKLGEGKRDMTDIDRLRGEGASGACT